jgi:hypothetical protein
MRTNAVRVMRIAAGEEVDMSAVEHQHLDGEHPADEVNETERLKDHYRPAPCVREIDYESAYKDITRRFPKIIARLAE